MAKAGRRAMKSQPLTGPEAARLYDNAPESIGFTLAEIVRVTGKPFEHLRGELEAGRLLAVGTPREDGGYDDVLVTADSFTEWLARPENASILDRMAAIHPDA